MEYCMNIKRICTTAAAFALALTVGVTSGYAEDKSPVNLRAVGGANMGGTWNVGLAGLGKLVNDRYPGSTFNILQGSSSSNPLRLDGNSGDITVTQSLNTYSALTGTAPYKKKLENLTSIANIQDVSRFHVICSKKVPVNSLDELLEKKLVKESNQCFVYDVKISCVGKRPVSGYLSIPKGAGPKSLPLRVWYEGYGVSSAPARENPAEITFSVNAHGIENGREPAYYKRLAACRSEIFGFGKSMSIPIDA